MNIKIRKVTQEDYPIILEMKKSAWGNPDWIKENCLEINSNDHLFAVEVDGILAAIQGYEIIDLDNIDMINTNIEKYMVDKYSYLFKTRNKICFLHSAITRPEFRMKGLAKKLLFNSISSTINDVDYYITDTIQRKDGSIPSKKLIEEYGFIKMGYEQGVWAQYFDGVNTICADCGPGKVCNCSTHVYFCDVSKDKSVILDILQKKILNECIINDTLYIGNRSLNYFHIEHLRKIFGLDVFPHYIMDDDHYIKEIEAALEVKLLDTQKNDILNNGDIYDARARVNGKTFAHCIKTALSEGEPLDTGNPDSFADYQGYERHTSILERQRYSRTVYLKMFLNIWSSLKNYGFTTRELK